MNAHEKNILLKIRTDCLDLERHGVLTEYGKGELAVCNLLLLESKKE